MKSRLFFCDYWEDMEESSVSPNARYLGAYLWTSQRANLIGLFAMTEAYIALGTGLSEESIAIAKAELETLRKVHFYKNWIYLPNAQRICGYTSKDKHDGAAQKEISRVPAETLEHFRSLGYDIPYRYTTDSPINHKQETRKENKEQEKPKETTDEDDDDLVKWTKEVFKETK